MLPFLTIRKIRSGLLYEQAAPDRLYDLTELPEAFSFTVQHRQPAHLNKVRRKLRKMGLHRRGKQRRIQTGILRGDDGIQVEGGRFLHDLKAVKQRANINIRHFLAFGALLDNDTAA